MSEPILSPEYWRQRLETAQHEHHAIFKCPLEKWRAIEAKHREILLKTIKPLDTILDAGCGWGRLLTLLPSNYRGFYKGLDISPDFIELAQKKYKIEEWCSTFEVADLQDLSFIKTEEGPVFDWAVLISMRPMVIRNLGEGVWCKMQSELLRVAHQLLFLEYDETDGGSIMARE